MNKTGKRVTAPLMAVTTMLLLCSMAGCNVFTKENSTNNLDLSNVKVTENIPESGEWKTMTFDYRPVNADTLRVLQNAVKAYGGEAIDESKVVCNIFSNGDAAPPDDVAYHDITAEMYKNAAYMRYVGDELYADTTIHGKIELYNRKNVKDILRIDYDGTWSWRPFFYGSVQRKIELQTASPVTDRYVLDGKTVSVDTALQYALSYINSGTLSPICSSKYEYTPLYVEVYQFEGEKYGYFFAFGLSYDGVPFDSAAATSAEKAPVSNTIKLLMLSENSVDWMWTCAMNQDTPVSKEKAEIMIDYEKACEIVSETLSKEHVFTVSKAELIYCTTELEDENTRWRYTGIKAEPMWQFYITNVGVQEYSSIYINVSATNGEVYMRYE